MAPKRRLPAAVNKEGNGSIEPTAKRSKTAAAGAPKQSTQLVELDDKATPARRSSRPKGAPSSGQKISATGAGSVTSANAGTSTSKPAPTKTGKGTKTKTEVKSEVDEKIGSKSRKASTPTKDESSTGPSKIASDASQTADDGKQYWLMKAEPESRFEKGVDVKFSIDDLKARGEKGEGWDGVRNPSARNNMRAMRKGELAFFYHSNCKVPGIAGVMEIVGEAEADETAQDPKHPYHDPKDTDPENPKWSLVTVAFRHKFPRLISLKELQRYKGPGDPLEAMQTLRMSRLSVSRVGTREWEFIMGLLEQDDGD